MPKNYGSRKSSTGSGKSKWGSRSATAPSQTSTTIPKRNQKGGRKK